MKRVIMVIEDKPQGGVEMHCEPPILDIASAIADGNTRSDAYGTAMFLTRVAQLIYKGDRGIDELIKSFKSARGDEKSNIIIPSFNG